MLFVLISFQNACKIWVFVKDSTPCRPKVSPLCTILRYPFLVTYPKIFLKARSAPIYTNLPKSDQKRLFWPVFSTKFFACGATFCRGSYYCFGRARKINLVDLKKVDKSFEFFLTYLEKILDPPMCQRFWLTRIYWQNKLQVISRKFCRLGTNYSSLY